MAQLADVGVEAPEPSRTGSGLEQWVFLGALAAVIAGLFATDPAVQLTLFGIGTGVFVGLTAMSVARLVQASRARALRQVLGELVAADGAASVLTDRSGAIVMRNRAAARQVAVPPAGALASALGRIFAAPGASVTAMIGDARRDGHARVDKVSHHGPLRISVAAHRGTLFVWRFEPLTPDAAEIAGFDTALPTLVAGPDGGIVAANAAVSGLVGEVPDTLAALIREGEVASGRVCAVATADGSRQVRLHVVADQATGYREIYMLPMEFVGISTAAQLFDTLPVPMLKVGLDGSVNAANQGACDLLGRDVPSGTEMTDVLTGLGRSVTDWLQDAVSGRGVARSEFLQVRGHDGERFVQVSLKPIEEKGETAVIAVLTDATELKTLEAQFVQSQKMQAIGQLAGGVAHDFNNLLTAISGHCDLLLLRHDEGDPAYGDLVQINQNANRAASLVGQLLAFSRKQTLSPEVVDLRDVLADLTHLLSRLVGEPMRLTLSHDDALPPVRVDKRQLEQVIMNLVVNARDAMPDGGEISVETSAVTVAVELRRNRAVIPPGDYAVIRVSDEGIGIPAENLQKIFEPFYTTKKTGEGTGLGLSTAYGIVKQTGGFIFADSVEGEGTVFTLYFPAHDAPPAPVAAPQPVLSEAETVPSDAVILLVEDEAPVRAFASRALKLRGFTVVEAENAEDALQRLADPELKVDLFVTDVVMPGMDGPTWVREARKARPETRVVFVSGYAEDALSDHQRRIPNSVFLPKPFSLQQLTTTVQEQLI